MIIMLDSEVARNVFSLPNLILACYRVYISCHLTPNNHCIPMQSGLHARTSVLHLTIIYNLFMAAIHIQNSNYIHFILL